MLLKTKKKNYPGSGADRFNRSCREAGLHDTKCVAAVSATVVMKQVLAVSSDHYENMIFLQRIM